MRITRHELSVWGVYTHGLKNLNFDGYSRRINQSGACSSSDMITSGGRKSKTTMEYKLTVVVCWYPELYDTTSYFYKNRNTFCNETGAACRSPSHDANSRLLYSEFHTRMKRISRTNEASKLKMFKSPTMHDVFLLCERTFRVEFFTPFQS